MKFIKSKSSKKVGKFVLIFLSFLALFTLYQKSVKSSNNNKCNFKSKLQKSSSQKRVKNQKYLIGDVGSKSTVLTNIQLIDGDGQIYKNTTIILENGIITRVGPMPLHLDQQDYNIIDGQDRFVTPGIVDMQ